MGIYYLFLILVGSVLINQCWFCFRPLNKIRPQSH